MCTIVAKPSKPRRMSLLPAASRTRGSTDSPITTGYATGRTTLAKDEDNCFDNAAIESFFGTLKVESFHLERPDSIDALEVGVHDYVHYYNYERIKLGLQGLSPVEYRLRSTA